MKTTFRYSLFCILFLVYGVFSNSIKAQSEDFNIEIIPVDKLINNNSITSIIQDSDGLIWIGTLNGIFRYDGLKAKRIYLSDRGSISNRVNCLYKDKKGDIWAGAGYDLIYWKKDQHKFRTYNLKLLAGKKLLRSVNIIKIGEDDSGNILIFTNFHIFRLNPNDNHADFFSMEVSFNSFDTFNINDNNIIGFSGNNFFICNKNKPDQSEINFQINNFHKKNKIVASGINARFIWYSNGGYSVIDNNNNLKFFTINNGKPNIIPHYDKRLVDIAAQINDIFIDHNGNYWIITKKGSLLYYILQEGKIVEVFNSLNHCYRNYSPITCISEDYSGNIFVGLKNGSIQKITIPEPKVEFIRIPLKNNIKKQESINSISEDETGKIWIASIKRISQSRNNSKSIIDMPSPPLSKKKLIPMQLLRFDKTGRMWVLSGNTLWVSDKTSNYTSFKKIFSQDNIAHITTKNFLLTKKGILILSDKLYLVSFTGEIINNIVIPDKQTPFRIFNDYSNNIWISTENTLYLYNVDRNRLEKDHIDMPWTPKLNIIISIICDSVHNRWLTVPDNGLYKILWKEQSKKWIFEKQQINSIIDYSFIRELCFDTKNNLWMGIDDLGLWKYNPITHFLQNISINESEEGTFFSPNASYLDTDGNLYFGSLNGFFRITPHTNYGNVNPAKLIFTEFKYSGVQLGPDEMISMDKLNLPSNTNSFSFECSLLDYTDHGRNIYFSKLEGFDTAWINMGNQYNGSYQNLDGGNYTLKITAFNCNGLLSKDTLTIHIFVPTPYYKTWWAFLSYICFTALMVYLVSQYRQKTNQIKLQQLRDHSRQYIEFQESERGRISRELHDSVNGILSYAKMKLSSIHDNQNEKTNSDLIKVEKLLDDTNMEIRRISHNLHPIILDELGLRGGLQNLIRTTKERHNIEIELRYINLPTRLDKDIQINIYRIIQEGLNNIVKHSTAEKGLVEIKKEDGSIKIIIQDNGRGFETDKSKNKILSFGLRNMSERASFFDGKFNIVSAPGKGTKIDIEIPYKVRSNDKQFDQNIIS